MLVKEGTYIDEFRDVELGERLLEDLEVINKLVFELGSPVDFVKRHLSWINDVQNLAVDCSCSQLLNL